MPDHNTKNCLACHADITEVDGICCPICGFMIAEIIGDINVFIENNHSEIERHRAAFIRNVSVETRIYCFDIEDGKLIEKPEERDTFGTLNDLYGRITWQARKFDALTERPELDATIYIRTQNRTEERTVKMPNIDKAEYYQLGIAVDSNFEFRILIRDQNGTTVESKAQPLF